MTPTVIPRAKIPQQSHTKMHEKKTRSQLLSPNHPQGQISSDRLIMETRGTETTTDEPANEAKGTVGSINRSSIQNGVGTAALS